jgi:hypothetical protein
MQRLENIGSKDGDNSKLETFSGCNEAAFIPIANILTDAKNLHRFKSKA